MKDLNLKKLESSSEFEKMCADLLYAEGCTNVRGLGVGPDAGRDILIDIDFTSPVNQYRQTYLVQCKWFGKQKSISTAEVDAVYGSIPIHNAQGLIFITASSFSGSCVTKMEAINNDRASYKVFLWDGNEVIRRLHRYPELIAKYWHAAKSSSVGDESFDSMIDWKKEFAMPPGSEDITIDSFLSDHQNGKNLQHLKKHMDIYCNNPKLVLLIEGVAGSGKTYYAYCLLNEILRSRRSVAVVKDYDFRSLYYGYILEGDSKFPSALSFIWDVDYLLLDGFGELLQDKSDTQVKAAEMLIDIVQRRITNSKPTIIVCDEIRTGPTIKQYVKFLKLEYHSVSCGSVMANEWWSKEEEEPERKNQSDHGFLGQNWLIEKMNTIERCIERAAKISIEPDCAIKARYKFHKETWGENMNREQEIYETLEHANKLLNGYKEFIGSFSPFLIGEDEEGIYLVDGGR